MDISIRHYLRKEVVTLGFLDEVTSTTSHAWLYANHEYANHIRAALLINITLTSRMKKAFESWIFNLVPFSADAATV